ncbi:MAG: hypothetical protein OSA95_06315 [Opitutales bacterium]|nr:hypothetical protein [Opitutales bacterium]
MKLAKIPVVETVVVVVVDRAEVVVDRAEVGDNVTAAVEIIAIARRVKPANAPESVAIIMAVVVVVVVKVAMDRAEVVNNANQMDLPSPELTAFP